MNKYQESWGERWSRWLRGWRAGQAEHYEWSDGRIVHRRGGRSCEAVAPQEIDAWWIDREAVHDVVHIRLRDGRVLDWPDVEFNLVGLLSRCGCPGARPTELIDDPNNPAEGVAGSHSRS